MKATASRERTTQVVVGAAAPLGATVTGDGVNFSVFSKHATGIDLLLFDHVDDAKPTRVIDVSPVANRTYHYWHVFVAGLKAGQIYGFRAHGPFDPAKGNRFDSGKVLLDPYGRGVVVPNGYNRAAAHDKGDNGSGKQMNLFEVAKEISERLTPKQAAFVHDTQAVPVRTR